jgi:murein DD-endopeptidase MepM/ murein hydrolase activator NlpD
MKTSTARSIAYSVVGVLAVCALRATPPMAARTPGERLAAVREAVTPALPQFPSLRTHTDTLERGETLRSLFVRGGVPERSVDSVLDATRVLDHRRIPAGMPVRMLAAGGDTQPSEIVLHLAVDRLLRLVRDSAGTWTGREERETWTTDTLAVAGTIESTLYEAIDAAAPQLARAARAEIAWSLADIFEYRVDMSRELQKGDAFRVLVERQRAGNGATRIGTILAADFTLSGDRVQAVRFGAGKGAYYDQQGKSLRAAFLRAPLEFRRISSRFGMRRHPILGTMRAHKGTDYAASSGTPVRAIGEGVVIRANYNRGYGNVLEIRHRNGYVSRYGHLRGFARGVRAGARVGIGETVAYVGSTGLSTAPHLHFEVLVGGVQRDPRVALASKTGFPLAASERRAFDGLRSRLMATLDAGLAPARVADAASAAPASAAPAAVAAGVSPVRTGM